VQRVKAKAEPLRSGELGFEQLIALFVGDEGEIPWMDAPGMPGFLVRNG